MKQEVPEQQVRIIDIATKGLHCIQTYPTVIYGVARHYPPGVDTRTHISHYITRQQIPSESLPHLYHTYPVVVV